jgi:exopolysaccharide production protein ExoZ
MSYELYFYIIFSLCLPLTWKFKYLIPLLVILSFVLIGKIISPDIYQLVFATNTLLLEFTFDICAYYFFKYKSLNTFVSALLILIAIISLYVVNKNDFNVERVIIYGVPAFIFFVGMIGLEPWLVKLQKFHIFVVLKKLGDSSYSLYLVHPFTLVICSIVLDELGISDFGVLFSIILCSFSLLSGHICYLLIERNISRVINNIGRTSR